MTSLPSPLADGGRSRVTGRSHRFDVEVDEWLSPKLKRAVLDRLRDRRDAMDRLSRTQIREQPDMIPEKRWSVWCHRVRLAATTAEFETWRQIQNEIEKEK